jgi:hypothetical protein
MQAASGGGLKLWLVAVPVGRWLAQSVGLCPLASDGRTAIACFGGNEAGNRWLFPQSFGVPSVVRDCAGIFF